MGRFSDGSGGSGSGLWQFSAVASGGTSGGGSGDGEWLRALSGMSGGSSGEGEHCRCGGFAGASSVLLSPSESSTELNSVCKSSLRTGKRPQLDRTKTGKDRTVGPGL